MLMKRTLTLITAAILVFSVFAADGNILAKAANLNTFNAKEFIAVKPHGFISSSRTPSTVTLKWEKTDGADGYRVQMKKNGEYVTVGETEKTSLTLTGLKSAKTYYLRLRAYMKDGKKTVFGKFSYLHACTSPVSVAVKSALSDNRKVTVKWKKQKCTGYQLQYSKNSDFSSRKSKTIAEAATTAYTTVKLSSNKKYYFRMRAFFVCDGKKYYSGWNTFTVRTDKGYKTTSKGYKIETKNGITYVDGILIANKTYSIPKSYAPGGLTKECSSAFSKMKKAAARDGVNLFIVSGYRSYDTQKRIYNNYVAKDGKALADTYSARPGTSEHQTGLAMDLNSLKSSFANTKEGKWLQKNAYKYGFIIRYPKGKQNITGYVYEPWHVRYVGADRAKRIYKSGLCLEEYYGITSKYK